METTGSTVLTQLESFHRDLREDALALRKDWQQIDRKLEELVSRRTAAIVELAQLYLPALTLELVQSNFSEIRGELQQILERKQRQVEELSGRKSRLLEELHRHGEQLKQVDSQLAELRGRQQQLTAEVTRQLAEHTEFQRISARVLDTENQLKALEQRGGELNQESALKLPPFQRNRLFQYLLARNYGTEDYVSRGWTRRMDRWLANLIGYHGAKRSYDFLLRVPQLFDREIVQRRQEFQLQMEQMETIEEGISDRVGLTPVLQETQQTVDRRRQMADRQAQTQGRIEELEQQLLTLSREGGVFYQEALRRLQQFLERTESTVLTQRASLTPTPLDDEIVSRITSLNRDIETTKPKIEKLEQSCREADQHVEGIDFVLRRFRQSSFADSRSRFQTSLPLHDLISQFRHGVLSREALWDKIRDYQRFEPTELERRAAEIVTHPMTGVLLEAMLQAAGGASDSQVRRTVQRRTSGGGGSGFPQSFPPPAMQLPRWERSSQPAPRRPPSPPSGPPRGYSSGKGF